MGHDPRVLCKRCRELAIIPEGEHYCDGCMEDLDTQAMEQEQEQYYEKTN